MKNNMGMEKELFSWDNVPGADGERLIMFLRDDLDIDWAENAEIRKSFDGRIIHISKDKHSAEIIIDEKNEKAILKISDGRTYDLNVKRENGKLNIYKNHLSGDVNKLAEETIREQIEWDRLSISSKEALEWAETYRRNVDATQIFSEMLLLGVMKQYPDRTEPELLLQEFGLTISDLEKSIKDVGGVEVANRDAIKKDTDIAPDELRNAISANTTHILSEAQKLSERYNPETKKRIRLPDVFGGILQTEKSIAYKALARCMKEQIDIGRFREPYIEFLKEGNLQEEDYKKFLLQKIWNRLARFLTVMLSDEVARTDTLGHESYVRVLAAFISDKKTETPLVIGLHGHWGTGKSSMMRQIEDLLKIKRKAEEKYNYEPCHTVFFDAWRYQEHTQILAAFALQVVHDVLLTMDDFQDRWRFRFRLFRERLKVSTLIKDTLTKVLIPLILSFSVLGLMLLALSLLEDVVPKIVASLLGSATITLLIIRVIDQLKESRLGFGNIEKYQGDPEYERKMGFTAVFKEDIGSILKAAIPRGERLVVFIDDLDRCTPSQTVKLIETINVDFPLQFERTVFVLGMDFDLVAKSIGLHYNELAKLTEKGDSYEAAFGQHFLEKIVQIRLRIPPPLDLKKFVDDLTNLERSVSDSKSDELDLAGPVQNELDTLKDKKIDNLSELNQELAERPHNTPREQQVLREVRQEYMSKLFDSEDSEVRRIAGEFIEKDFSANPRQSKRFFNLFRLLVFLVDSQLSLNPGYEVELNRWTLPKLAEIASTELRNPHLMEILHNVALIKDDSKRKEEIKELELNSQYDQMFRDKKEFVKFINDPDVQDFLSMV